jgi:hypothetical protein
MNVDTCGTDLPHSSTGQVMYFMRPEVVLILEVFSYKLIKGKNIMEIVNIYFFNFFIKKLQAIFLLKNYKQFFY